MGRLGSWADGSGPGRDDCLSTQQNICLEDCFRKAPMSDLSAMCGTEDQDASMMNDMGHNQVGVLSYVAFCVYCCVI